MTILGRLSERNKKYSAVDVNPSELSDDKYQYEQLPEQSQMNEEHGQMPQNEEIDYGAVDYFEPTMAMDRPLPRQRTEQEYGDTRAPVKLATEIENDPTSKGVLEINVGGRPIDLHQLENYMVWKTSPFVMKTLMRYHNAKTMEEIKSYSSRRIGRGGSMNLKTIGIILLCIVMAVAGLIMVMFMPQIMAFFRGFGSF